MNAYALYPGQHSGKTWATLVYTTHYLQDLQTVVLVVNLLMSQ